LDSVPTGSCEFCETFWLMSFNTLLLDRTGRSVQKKPLLSRRVSLQGRISETEEVDSPSVNRLVASYLVTARFDYYSAKAFHGPGWSVLPLPLPSVSHTPI
jgi:hypothetical protein